MCNNLYICILYVYKKYSLAATEIAQKIKWYLFYYLPFVQ